MTIETRPGKGRTASLARRARSGGVEKMELRWAGEVPSPTRIGNECNSQKKVAGAGHA